MSISGNLKTMALADLLQWLAEDAKTGTLRLDNGSFEKQLHFFEGRVISTSSSDPKEYLGHFLVSHGYITEIEQARALEMQEGNKMLLGKILISIGVITEEVLERMLYLKSEETLYELFTWPEGEFKFFDGELPESSLHPIDLNVTSVVLRGAQRLDEWNRIRSVIPSSDVVAVSVRELASDVAAEAAVLAAIDDDRTIAEIAMHTHSSEFHVGRILTEQIEAGNVKVVRPRGQARASSETITATSSEALIQEAQRRLDDLDYLGCLRHLRAARSLDPDNREVARVIKEAEEQVLDALRSEGIEPSKVPRVCTKAEDLGNVDITPDEGFLLSRINGQMDLKTILIISPLDPLEAQVAFLHLRNAGYVEFD